jgi:hypothetical protein
MYTPARHRQSGDRLPGISVGFSENQQQRAIRVIRNTSPDRRKILPEKNRSRVIICYQFISQVHPAPI